MIKLLKRKKERNLTQAGLRLLQQETIISTEQKSEAVDLRELLQECYGEIEMLEELVRLFKQNIYEFIGAVKIAISNQNFEEIYQASHKIKAGLALMNTNDLKRLIEGIEEGAKNTELAKIELLFAQFIVQYPLKEAQIDKELKKLKKR
jgi:HPt (histidine-containing phosphotransfer) domain-containing protein